MVACLERNDVNTKFHQIVDFLTSSLIHYALTVTPTIYTSYIEQFWATAKSKTVNNVKQIHATVDGNTVVITESSVRSDLHFNDEDGITYLTNDEIFENLTLMGVLALEQSKTTQDLVIKKLHKKVKRLEKKQLARTPGINLFKIGTSRRKILDKENVSKWGRNLKTRIEEGDFDDDINDMVDKAIENVEGDIVNAATGVSVTSASVTTAGVSISTTEPRTPPTTTTKAFRDENLTITQTLVKMRNEKAKEKRVVFSNVEEYTRPTTILPTIDPKDKGKGIMQEPEKPPRNLRKAQILMDEVLALRLHEEEKDELERMQRDRSAQEEASNDDLTVEFDNVQARIDADALLAVKLQEEEREQFV
nr:hypothetical protein [Tanacetum cinerariifolium]